MNPSSKLSKVDAFPFWINKKGSDKKDVVLTTAAIDKNEDLYKMNHPKRGMALIFNHQQFDSSALDERHGTEKDATTLTKVLKKHKFNVAIYNDLNYGAIYDVLVEVSQMDHSGADCLVIVVLSHGDLNKIYAKDQSYPTETLWIKFTGDQCTTLAGKPKLFFLQACRGDKVDDGVSLHRIESDSSTSKVYSIPMMADLLVMYASYEGFYSWRSPACGSWFIQSLCIELDKHGENLDLNTILTFVNRRVASTYKSYVPTDKSMHEKKQMCTIVSTLTRLLYFSNRD